MKIERAVAILKTHNEWRRGAEIAKALAKEKLNK